jgi:hypothetical protein
VPLVAAAAASVAGLVALVSHVKTHTRKLPSGRTVTVHGHTRYDDGGMTEQQQDRRDRFGQRVQRERTRGLRSATTPGEKRRKPGAKQMRKAKRHARKAMRMWRRHKVKAVAYGMLAGGEALSGLTRKGASGVRKLARSAKRRRRARRRRRK